MRKLNITQTIYTSMFLLLLPAAANTYLLASRLTSEITFSEKEIEGNDFEVAAVDALSHITRLRANTVQFALNAVPQVKVEEALSAAEKAMERLRAGYARHGEMLSFTPDALAASGRADAQIDAIDARWKQIKSNMNKENAASLEALYTQLIAQLRMTITHLGDTSNLILDPDLDSYYTMDVTLLALPDAMQKISDAEMYFYGRLLHGEALGTDARFQALLKAAQLRDVAIDRTKADFDTAIAQDKNFYGESASFRAEITAALKPYEAHLGAFINALEAIGSGAAVSAGDFAAAAENARTATLDLWHISSREMSVLLDTRVASHNRFFRLFIALTVVTAVMAMGVLIFLLRNVIVPIKKLSISMQHLSHGKPDAAIPYTDRSDELGHMARALKFFKDAVANAQEVTKRQLEESSEKLTRQERMAILIKDFDGKASSVLTQVSGAASELSEAAGSMVEVASNTDNQAGAIAISTEQTSDNVRAVAAAAEELAASIREIASQVTRTAVVSNVAVNNTESADSTVKRLAKSAAKIGDVVKMISEIADQINLLALNATIESARAGDAGKGFAVVASEVKNLASQTTKATSDIAAQIADIQQVTQEVVAALSTIKGTIGEMKEISTAIASAVEEQGAATQEIARNIQVASTGVSDVTANMTAVRENTLQTSQVAEKVKDAAHIFARQSQGLKEQVEAFLSNIDKAA